MNDPASREEADPDGGDAALRRRQEVLLDEAIQETFPASDPISPSVIRLDRARREPQP